MTNSYHDRSNEELVKTLQEKRKELREFRFNIAGTKVRNVKEGRDLKKEIARILTVLNSKNT